MTARRARRAHPPGRSRSGWLPDTLCFTAGQSVAAARDSDRYLQPRRRAEPEPRPSLSTRPAIVAARTQRERVPGKPQSAIDSSHTSAMDLAPCPLTPHSVTARISGLSGARTHRAGTSRAKPSALLHLLGPRFRHSALQGTPAHPRNRRNTTGCVRSGCGSARTCLSAPSRMSQGLWPAKLAPGVSTNPASRQGRAIIRVKYSAVRSRPPHSAPGCDPDRAPPAPVDLLAGRP